jgi:DnaJ domain
LLIYPLEWPIGWARARTHYYAKFGPQGNGALLVKARDGLLHELELLDAEQVQISTNLQLGKDGGWRNAPEPTDHGAAVYFRIANQARALACDKWLRVADNLHALALHVGAIRGQLRWGVGSVDQAFGGYKALPAMGARKLWYEVLAVPHTASKAEIERKRLELLGKLHPDRPGGDAEAAADVNAAYREALEVLAAEARA